MPACQHCFSTGSTSHRLSAQWCQQERSFVQSLSTGGSFVWILLMQRVHLILNKKLFNYKTKYSKSISRLKSKIFNNISFFIERLKKVFFMFKNPESKD